MWDAVKGNITRLSDASEWIEVVDGAVEPLIENAEFASAAATLVPDDLDGDSWSAFTNAVKEKTGAKGKNLFMPLRLALTGRQRGPEMAALFPLIGAEKARARLRGENT